MLPRVIVATLMLSPFMLHAQANSPAQTPARSNLSVLESELRQPDQLFAATNLGIPKTAAIAQSTGVTPPKLVHSVNVTADSMATWRLVGNNCKFVVSMVVDTTGKPSELKILESPAKELDQNVLAAVRQYRFTPGMVSNQPVAFPLNLEVVIVSPLQ